MAQDDDDFTPRTYRVTHRTTYTYDDDVRACYERGYLRPRETPQQRVLEHELVIDPEPDVLSEHVDIFGNHSHYAELRTPHRTLEIVKRSLVAVHWPRVDLDALDRWTVREAAGLTAAGVDGLAPVELAMTRLPSAVVGSHPEVADYARSLLAPDLPLGQALHALTVGIRRDFSFTTGVTSVRTTLPELLELRAGVCQDFTHLSLGVLRSFGLSARYVSGYIETFPRPGTRKLTGSDASHAWVSVAVPDGTWVDLDPTNSQVADSRYIVTGWGRDFGDMSPLRGVVYTEAGTSTLDVGVDVVREPDPVPAGA